MPRFFVPSENLFDGYITVTGDDAFHIARSLRMAEGDEITVCDMKGREHTCRLTKIRDEICECEILKTVSGDNEPPHPITLYMAYPKGDKLETVIQKAVELGCEKIVPFESSRCIKKPKAEKQDKQTARFCRIAEEAAKQCGRSKLPTVSHPIGYKEMLKLAREAELALFCYEGGGESLKSVLDRHDAPKSISVIVGCEGGFSNDEADLARESGCTAVTLGKRILRCETAPSYVLAAISYKYEL